MNIKSAWKKFWWFIWEDESWASWAANIILAFILIKFIVYPGLGFAFGTSHPVVAVVSGSMEHPGENWWFNRCGTGIQEDIYKQYNIDYEEFRQFPFRNGFNKGDIMVLWGRGDTTEGDVIVFGVPGKREPIIHRVVDTRSKGPEIEYQTKGDNNCGSAAFENNIKEEQIIGKAVFRIPYLGWVKLSFQTLVNMI